MNIYHEIILVFLASISAFSLLWMAIATTQKKVTSYSMPEIIQTALQSQINMAYYMSRLADAQEARNKAMEISLKKIEGTV